MDYKAMLSISVPIGLAIAAFGSAIALGKAVAAAMEADGRQPEASMGKTYYMIAGCALIEALQRSNSLVLSFSLLRKDTID